MNKDKALKLALEAYLCREMPAGTVIGDPKWWVPKIANAIKEALVQPEQEPVALEAVYETIIQWDEGGGKRSRRELARRIVALYTSPPAQRTWVGLTDCEREKLRSEADEADAGYRKLIKATEAKLKRRTHETHTSLP